MVGWPLQLVIALLGLNLALSFTSYSHTGWLKKSSWSMTNDIQLESVIANKPTTTTAKRRIPFGEGDRKIIGGTLYVVNETAEFTRLGFEEEDEDTLQLWFEQQSPSLQSILLDKFFDESNLAQDLASIDRWRQQQWDIENGVYEPPSIDPMFVRFNIDYRTALGKYHFNLGNFTEAMEWYRAAITVAPGYSRPWMGVAKIHSRRRELKEAEAAFKEGLYYNPDCPYLAQALSEFYIKQGRINEAKGMIASALKKHPSFGPLWSSSATLAVRRGDIQQARYSFMKAMAANPDDSAVLIAAGDFEKKQNQLETARQYLEKGLELSPLSYYAMHSLADIQYKAGNLSAAVELYSHYLGIIPRHTFMRSGLALCLERQGKIDEARKQFKTGLSHARSNGDAGFIQTFAMFEQRRYQDMLEKVKGPVLQMIEGLYDGEVRLASSLDSIDFNLNIISSNYNYNNYNSYNSRNSMMTATTSGEKGFRSTAEIKGRQLLSTLKQPIVLSSNANSLSNGNFSLLSNDNLDLIVTQLGTVGEVKGVLAALTRLTSSSLDSNPLVLPVATKLDERQVLVLQRLSTQLLGQLQLCRGLFALAVKTKRYHSASWTGWATLERFYGDSGMLFVIVLVCVKSVVLTITSVALFLLEMARKLLVAGIAVFPTSKNIGRFHQMLGGLFAEQGDLLQARSCFDRAITTTPPQYQVAAYLEYVKAELELGGPSKTAKRLIDLALSKFPTNKRYTALLSLLFSL